MKKMEEIKKMKESELISLVTEGRETLRNERFGGSATGHQKAVIKKEIARALTELQARSRANSTEA